MSRRGWVAVLFLLVAVAISGCGCGGDDENEPSASATTTPDASASTKPDSTKPGSRGDGSKKPGSKRGGRESGSNESGSSKATPQESGKQQKPTKPATPGGTPGGGTPVGTVPSGGGPTADERAVVRTVREYLRSIARGDGVQACAQLTPEGRRAIEREVARAAPETKGSPCETAIVLYQSSYRNAAEGVRVTNVSVAGDRAKAVALDEAARLVKLDRTWLIARYGR